MAKKKKRQNIANLINEVTAELKSDSVGTFVGSEAIDLVEEWIPSTNVALNYMLGDPVKGAFPQGRVIEIYGPKSSAKSLILYDAGAQCQKMGGVFLLVDSESAFHKGWGKYLGIDFDRFIYAPIRTIEEAFDTIRETIERLRAKRHKGPILIGWDSIAASARIADLEIDIEDSKSEMGGRAKLMSQGMRDIPGLCFHENATLIMINQIRKKIGVMFGDPETRPGGEAVPFHSSQGIMVRRSKKIFSSSKGLKRVVGHKVIVTCEKNRVRPPFAKTDINVYIDKVTGRYGLDQWSGLIELLEKDGILIKDGKYHNLTANLGVSVTSKTIKYAWDEHIIPSLPDDPYDHPTSTENEDEDG